MPGGGPSARRLASSHEHAARSDGSEDATLSARRSAQAGAGRAWMDRLFVREGRTQMGKLMKRAEKFARSPKAKTLEKKMLRKAEDPKTREKISKRFAKFRKKA
jgi:hypothetical protein